MIFFGFLITFLSNILIASDYSNFKNVTDRKAIEAFVKDLTSMTSSSILYSARVLGIHGSSLGYKISYLTEPSNSNTVFEKKKAYNISFLQGEMGLPFRIDLFMRVGGKDGYNVIGGGVRYGLKKPVEKIYGFNSSFLVYSHMGLYRDFYLVSFGAQLAFSMKLSDSIIPFISGGFDNVKFLINSHSQPLLEGEDIHNNVYKGNVGVRFKIDRLGRFNLVAAVETVSTGRNIVDTAAVMRF
ncbi:MAG: hypothetical protein ACP5IO_05365 [Elusimicrobiales bacterium]